jgi:hypothetical protein
MVMIIEGLPYFAFPGKMKTWVNLFEKVWFGAHGVGFKSNLHGSKLIGFEVFLPITNRFIGFIGSIGLIG